MYMFFLNWACFVKRARPMFHKEQSFVASSARNPHTYRRVHIFIYTPLCDQTQSAVLYLHVMVVIGISYSLFSYIDLLWCYAGFGSVLYVYLTVRQPSSLTYHFIPFVGCQPSMCTCSVTNKWRSDLVRGLV